MTREARYDQLQRISRSKDGMLQLQAIRQRLCGRLPVRNDDSLERLIKEILDVEYPPCPSQATSTAPTNEVSPRS